MVDRAFRQIGLTPEPRLTADSRDAVYEAVAIGLGVGFMWRHGTCRSDAVRRVTVQEMLPTIDEVAFALEGERNAAVDLFFHAAADYGRSVG
jgi:DNA-binding transcriptional LysR family regulator